eukprot:m.321772 g.321772  ORF g.321772 m.321772 type:complete len:59 (-) comp20338_c0_seq13:1634-1810(-)
MHCEDNNTYNVDHGKNTHALSQATAAVPRRMGARRPLPSRLFPLLFPAFVAQRTVATV